jgi:uncharacterized protein (DUF1778 family)
MPTEKRTRSKFLVLRLSAEERTMLEALADTMGLSLSDAMRQALRSEARRRGVKLPRSSQSRA